MSQDPGKPPVNGEDSEARLRRLRENFARASNDLDRSAAGKTPPARRKAAPGPVGQTPTPRTNSPKTGFKLDWWGVVLIVTAVLVVVFAVRDWIT